MGSAWLGSSSVKRDVSVLVDHKLDMNEQYAANKIKPTGYWVASARASPAEIKKSLSYSLLVRPYLEYSAQFWSLLYQREVDSLEGIKGRATKTIKGLGSLPYGCLRELGLFRPEKRKLRGDFVAVFQYLKSGYKGDNSLFTESHE